VSKDQAFWCEVANSAEQLLLPERPNDMRYHALVTDYDSTIAEYGVVSDKTIQALERLRATGRCLIMVTGRELDDLFRAFPRVDLFDRIVAENGALLYHPATRETRLLCEPPPPEFLTAVRDAGIFPLALGKVIVATLRPNETEIIGIIRDLGLELHVIFNHEAVMVLPSGVNKASGLQAALADMGLSSHNCVGVGDAENDHAFLALTECAAAVGNALDALKKRADFVCNGAAGEGVTELIERLIESDLRHLGVADRHRVVFGTRDDDSEVSLGAFGSAILIAGPPGSGKSTLANTFVEKLRKSGYQFCIIDPRGEYLSSEGAVVLGDREHPPSASGVMDVLANPLQNVTVNLLGVPPKERATFFEGLLQRIQELRSRTGRPHWLILDEAHSILPSSWEFPSPSTPEGGLGILMITVEPAKLPPGALRISDLVISVGEASDSTLALFSDAVGHPHPALSQASLEPGDALGWPWRTGEPPFRFRFSPGKAETQRHRRKYSEGELAPEVSFYFRGAEKKLNLRAQNLSVFIQMAEGVDDETWLFHLQKGDVSQWFRDVIKDRELANEARKLETPNATAAHSRALIRAEIEKRYMVAA
jgi:hydroxymethylpyrimidine pyrophosphatase-like HAD family hydrolase/energy-coupling factor transporter ATP-binding protein EcfA2